MAEPISGEDRTGTGENPGAGSTEQRIKDGTSGAVGSGIKFEPGKPFIVNPADIGRPADAPANSGGPRNKRGRPKTRTATAPGFAPQGETTSLDVQGVEKILLSTHMLLAGIMKAPGMVLTEMEAHALAEAAINVQRHYPQFQAAQKTIDWVNLGTIVVLTYGTRIAAASKRKRDERAATNAAQAPQGDGVVVNFPPGMTPQ